MSREEPRPVPAPTDPASSPALPVVPADVAPMPPTRRSVGLRSERGPLLAGLMVATFLVALNQTIVATAVPSVVDDLGGFTQFPWLFSIYLLAQTITMPLLGRLSDIIGRRPIMLGGIAVFIVASALCALAWSMPVLIAFRALQGIGSGAVLPMSNTIAGDVYSFAERAKVQGYIAIMWASASMLGPVVGGLLVSVASWRTVFWISVPLGIAAGLVVRKNFREVAEPRITDVDYTGALLLAAGTGMLLLGLLEGGQAWAWASRWSVATLGGGSALLTLFALSQRRVTAPIVPPWIFRRRILVAANGAAVSVGAIILGLTSYLATFAQGALGTSAIAAGLTLGALTVGWPLASAFAGQLYTRVGFRTTAVMGSAVALTGTVLVATSAAVGELAYLAAACLLVGCGIGLVANPTLIAAQSSVGWSERGVITATNLFCRSMGSTVAVAVFGALANASLADRGGAGDPSPEALADAATSVFLGVVVVAALMIAPLLLLPGRAESRLFDARP